jgi:putative membrane protein
MVDFGQWVAGSGLGLSFSFSVLRSLFSVRRAKARDGATSATGTPVSPFANKPVRRFTISLSSYLNQHLMFRTVVLTMIAVLVGSWLLPGVWVDGHWWNVVVVAVVISLLNAIVRPLLIFLTIPATIITLGLFIFVINAATILLADYLLDGFRVDSFWWALLFSFILSLITSLAGAAERNRSERY